jgi:hypothetical protein
MLFFGVRTDDICYFLAPDPMTYSIVRRENRRYVIFWLRQMTVTLELSKSRLRMFITLRVHGYVYISSVLANCAVCRAIPASGANAADLSLAHNAPGEKAECNPTCRPFVVVEPTPHAHDSSPLSAQAERGR